jgi:hypothetical protein
LYALLSLRVVGGTISTVSPLIAGGHISELTGLLMIILASIFSLLGFNIFSSTNNRLLFCFRLRKMRRGEDPIGYALDLRKLGGLELQNLVEWASASEEESGWLKCRSTKISEALI